MTGCTSPPEPYHRPAKTERTIDTIRTLYEDSREKIVVSNQVQYAFVDDSDFVKSAEAALLKYSYSDDSEIQAAAASRLAHFGTENSFKRAIEVAQTLESPPSRGQLWQAIALLLDGPVVKPSPSARVTGAWGGLTNASRNNHVFILTDPELSMSISHCFDTSVDYLLPKELDIESLQNIILEQYVKDDGFWTVTVADKIPFVPFYEKRHAIDLTVRQDIASALLWHTISNDAFANKLKGLSTNRDPDISDPIKKLLNDVQTWNEFKQRRQTQKRLSE